MRNVSKVKLSSPRTIVVRWRDANGQDQAEPRTVRFCYGFGHYVRWNRRFLLVEHGQTEIAIDDDLLGPAAHSQRRL